MALYDVENSKTAKLKKAYVVGANQTTEKLKKAYVVNAEKKLEKLWSGFTPMFVSATRTRLFHSEDGKKWEVQDIPWDTTYNSSSSKQPTMGITYGLGKYWLAHGKYLCSSEDGITWTIDKISDSPSPYKSFGFHNAFFVNNQIVVYERVNVTSFNTTYTLHVTSDGVNWSTIDLGQPSFSLIKDMVYGTYKGNNVYFWMCMEGERGTLYTSATLDGPRTLITTRYSGGSGSDCYYAQMVIPNANKNILVGLDKNSSGSYTNFQLDLTTGYYTMGVLNYNSSYPHMLLCATNSELLAYQYSSGFRYKKLDGSASGNYSTGTQYVSSGQYVMHPPHNESGLVSFVMDNSSKECVCAIYKADGASAFTKVTNVADLESDNLFVSAYSTDGGGWS